MADSSPSVVVPASREKNAPQLACVNFFNRFDDGGRAAALGSQLDNPMSLARRRNHQLAFVRIMAGRFFDIDMLARRAG